VLVYLSVDQVLLLHELQIERFGGSPGLRDRGGLESAVARATMTFDGEDLYPDAAAKAAALMHSLVMNHPFVDGNKRVGVAAAEFFLKFNGFRLGASNTELEELTLSAARGELDAESLGIWFRQRVERAE
jgi:death-on-curing protein